MNEPHYLAVVDCVADGKPFRAGESLAGVRQSTIVAMLRCGQASERPSESTSKAPVKPAK